MDAHLLDDKTCDFAYLTQKQERPTADAHLRLVFRSCTRLLDNPALGRARDEVIRGLRSIVVDPHIVYYRHSDDAIEIV